MVLAAAAHACRAGDAARCASAAAASPRVTCTGGSTYDCAASASSMVRIAGSGSMSSCAELRRAPRELDVGRGHGEHRLARELRRTSSREDRIVVLDRADVVHAGNVGGGDDARRRRARRAPPRDRCRAAVPCAIGTDAERRVQRAARLRQVVGVRAPRRATCSAAESCGTGAPTGCGASSSCGRARGSFIAIAQRVTAGSSMRVRTRAPRVSSHSRRIRLPSTARRYAARRAHVVDRRELAGERAHGGVARSPRSTAVRRARPRCAVARFGDRRDAAAADARADDAPAVELQREAGEHRGDVLVVALADLVARAA